MEMSIDLQLDFDDRISRYKLSADKQHLCVVTGHLLEEGGVQLRLHYFTGLLASPPLVANASIDLGPGAQVTGLACSERSIAYARAEDRYSFRAVNVKRSNDSSGALSLELGGRGSERAAYAFETLGLSFLEPTKTTKIIQICILNEKVSESLTHLVEVQRARSDRAG